MFYSLAFEKFHLSFREIRFGFVELYGILNNCVLNFLDFLFKLGDIISSLIKSLKIFLIDVLNVM